LVLARVANGSERARRLRAARRALRELERIDLPMAAAYALQLAAGIAHCRGDESGAIDALRRALTGAEAHGTELHTACIQWRLGALSGDEGRALRTRGESWMAAESVRVPERFVNAVLPGWAPGE